MEHGFYKSGFTSGLRGVPSLFTWVTVLLISFSPCSSQEPAVNEELLVRDSNANSTVNDFQEVKAEVGYRDPQRYGKGEPETLIRMILIGAGVWCLIAIFLFALFHRPSVDQNWVRDSTEQDDDLGS